MRVNIFGLIYFNSNWNVHYEAKAYCGIRLWEIVNGRFCRFSAVRPPQTNTINDEPRCSWPRNSTINNFCLVFLEQIIKFVRIHPWNTFFCKITIIKMAGSFHIRLFKNTTHHLHLSDNNQPFQFPFFNTILPFICSHASLWRHTSN